jgi:hypothetical protein
MSSRIDIIGKRFGRLVVVAETAPDIYKSGLRVLRFSVKCDCGGEADYRGYQLRNGAVQSCGCLRREKAAELALSRTVHGDNRLARIAAEHESWTE